CCANLRTMGSLVGPKAPLLMSAPNIAANCDQPEMLCWRAWIKSRTDAPAGASVFICGWLRLSTVLYMPGFGPSKKPVKVEALERMRCNSVESSPIASIRAVMAPAEAPLMPLIWFCPGRLISMGSTPRFSSARMAPRYVTPLPPPPSNARYSTSCGLEICMSASVIRRPATSYLPRPSPTPAGCHRHAGAPGWWGNALPTDRLPEFHHRDDQDARQFPRQSASTTRW